MKKELSDHQNGLRKAYIELLAHIPEEVDGPDVTQKASWRTEDNDARAEVEYNFARFGGVILCRTLTFGLHFDFGVEGVTEMLLDYKSGRIKSIGRGSDEREATTDCLRHFGMSAINQSIIKDYQLVTNELQRGILFVTPGMSY